MNKVQGVIKNFRRGVRTMTGNQAIIEIVGIENKAQAEKFVGSKVSWKSSAGKEINGKIASAHGDNGAIRARFDKGLPGQAVGDKVEVISK